MIALCVDDEDILLGILIDAVGKSPDIAEVVAFSTGAEAVNWAKSNKFDIAFLDIELSDMNGIELSSELRAIHPNLPIFFCTAYPQYSLDAIMAHANGYILKSITPEKIQKEIDYLKGTSSSPYLLKVNCDDGFFLYDKNDKPLEFPRKKAVEVLAVMVHREGSSVSILELCDYLFPEIGGSSNESNKNHIYKLISDIRKKLKSIDAESVFVKDSNGYKLDMSLIEDISKTKRNYMQGFTWINNG